MVSVLPSIGIAQRIFRAHSRLEVKLGRKVTNGQFGDMVAEELGRKEAYSHAAAGDWIRRGVKDVDVLWGIARACGVNFLWLAAGEGPMLSQHARMAGEEEIALNPPPRTPAAEALRVAEPKPGEPARKRGTRKR